MARQKYTGITGLPLSRRAIRILRERGIYAYAPVSIEHQTLAGRYVLRGLESGGPAENAGRYLTFSRGEGQKLEGLHPRQSIAVSGLHAVVIASEFVRADMLRKDRTYELLITGHRLGPSDDGSRPQLQTEILFRGIHGRIELDLSRRDKAEAGRVVPSFYSLAGEQVAVPERFVGVVRAVTHGVNCIGCSHSHYLRKSGAHPLNQASSTGSEPAIAIRSA